MSFYNHLRNHIDETMRGYVDGNGTFRFFENLSDFIFSGALDSFIVKLYLLESIFQGCAGTMVGLSLGLALAFLEGLSIYGTETWRLMPGATFAKLTGICLVTGVTLTILSALYPAWRAARLNVVESLRYE